MKKKLTTKQFVLIGVLSLALIGGVSIASANLSFMDRIADKAGEILGLSLSDKIDIPVEDTLAGSGGTFQTDWYKIGNRVTWIKSGQFSDATTTLFSFLNPVDQDKATSTSDVTYNNATHWVSTSTAVSINLDITGVSTSSAVIICGGASDQYSTPTYELFNLTLATSTLGVYNNNQTTTTDGIGVVGTGSATQILLTHDYDYFNCVATNVGDADDLEGFTNPANTFNGYWSVEVMKNLQ